MKLPRTKLLTSLKKVAQTIRQLGIAQLSLVERQKENSFKNLINSAATKQPMQLHISFLSFQTNITIQTTRRQLPLPKLPKEISIEFLNRTVFIPLRHAPMRMQHRQADAGPKRIALTLFGKQFFPPFKPQTAFSLSLVVAGLLGTLYFSLMAGKPAAIAPPAANNDPIISKVESAAYVLPRSLPVRLQVPAAKVDTKFIKLGKKADGTLKTPDRYDIAGWYKYSPTPGEIGPAIIVGHVDSYKGPAVFFWLKELKKGDAIKVTRADGSIVKFRVDTVKQFMQNDFPTQKVYGNLNYSGLRLITCGGVFNNKTLEYNQNTVVYASLVH